MLHPNLIRLRSPVLGVIVACVLAACGGAQARYADHIDRGNQYLAAGDLSKASIEFRNALQIRPKSAEALYLTGQVAERRGNIREAVGLYQAAIDTAPKSNDARAALAGIYTLAGAPEKALELIAPALREHADDPDLLTVRAAANLQLQKPDQARSDAERAVQLAPANEKAVALLAALYAKGGDPARAISIVNTAISQKPQSPGLRGVLANLYLTADQPERAEEQMHKLIELQPSQFAPRFQLALYYARSHKLDEAQNVLQDAVKALPKDQQAKLTLVDFISSQRSRDQGEKILREFIAKEPDNYDLRLGLGTLLERSGATRDAIVAYEDIIARDTTGAQGMVARDRIAAIDLAQGRYEDAQNVLAQVLEKNPRDNDALILRANIALRQGDPTRAIVDLRAVLRDQPQAVPVLRALASAHLAAGAPALAEESLRKAIEAAPTDVAVRVDLAQLLSQTDRVDQAVSLLEETVRRTPTDLRAREALARVYLAKRDFAATRQVAEDLKTLRPDLAAGFYYAGLAAQGQNRPDDARSELGHALELQPNGFEALAALARLELAQGKAPAGIARVQAAVDHDPKNVLALNLLGELYIATHDLPRAVQTLTHATELDPNWWMPYRNLALAKLAAKDTAGAIAAYQAGIHSAPAEAQLTLELANLFERQGRVDDAIACYDALYRRNPRLQLAANNLAMLLVTYKKDQQSLDRARELTVAFDASDSGDLLDTGGWVRFKRGEFNDAVRVLERAIQRAPDSNVIHYHLGMAELRVGERARARANLEAALSGSASFSGVAEARAALASLTSG
jgi:tetratricopeptide (TPR) repeat protein